MRGDWGLWWDARIPGDEHWVYGHRSELMEVPTVLEQCVCFVEAGWGQRRDYVGTAFLVSYPSTIPGAWEHAYAVTAKHVLEPEPLEDGTPAPPYDWVALKFNQAGGDPVSVETDISSWETHPTADVACYFLDPPPSAPVINRWFGIGRGVTRGEMDEHGVGAGADIVVMGLFVHHPGVSTLVPVARLGSVAALPRDPIPDDYTQGENVILAETRSIGGLSGSPVFYVQPIVYLNADGEPMARTFGPYEINVHFLIGLVQSVWDEDGRTRGARDFRRPREPLNVGMTVVEPVDRILEVIEGAVFVKKREAKEAEQRKDSGRRAVRSQSETDRPTRDQFLRDLMKVTTPEEPPSVEE